MILTLKKWESPAMATHLREMSISIVAEDVIAVHQRDLHLAQVPNEAPGQATFDAMVRLVDRDDRSWRD